MGDEGVDWPAYRRAVGNRLRDLRRAVGLSQEKFAEAAGVSRTVVQRTERAQGEVPGLLALWRMARACGAPIHELLRDDRGADGD